MRRVLGEVLDVVDGVVPALLDVVAEVLDVPDGAAGGGGCVLGQVGDGVAEFVDGVA
jgi:hypothetical protein